MPDINLTVLSTLRGLALTLEHAAGATNTIMQFCETYILKGAAIQQRLRDLDRENLLALVSGLKSSTATRNEMNDAAVAEIAKAYIEAEALKKCHAYDTAARVVDTALSSVRVILGVTPMSDALKAALKGSGDPKVN